MLSSNPARAPTLIPLQNIIRHPQVSNKALKARNNPLLLRRASQRRHQNGAASYAAHPGPNDTHHLPWVFLLLWWWKSIL